MKNGLILVCAFLFTCASVGSQIGSVDPTFSSSIDGPAWAIALQADGRILVGGQFLAANGEQHHSIVRLETNGVVDRTFTASVDSQVWAIAVQDDGQILIGGRFFTVNGTNRNCLARLNPDGGLDLAFDAGSLGDQFVFAIVPLPGGQALIGGEFTHVGGISRNGIARINPNGSVDVFFDPGLGANPVRSIAVQADGHIMIGGSFATVDGHPPGSIARLLATGELDPSFTAPSIGPVLSVAIQQDGRAVIGGLFTQVDSTNRNGVARLTSEGRLDLSFDPGAGANTRGGLSVWTVKLQQNGDVLLAGAFSTIDGVPRPGLARLKPTGTLDSDFIPQLPEGTQFVPMALDASGNVLVGGLIRIINVPNTIAPATLSAATYLGLSIDGTPGGRYRIEYNEQSALGGWRFLTNVVLPSVPFLWIDLESTNVPRRMYRAIAAP
jgi:uncharacterized delta-60 repeat protein